MPLKAFSVIRLFRPLKTENRFEEAWLGCTVARGVIVRLLSDGNVWTGARREVATAKGDTIDGDDWRSMWASKEMDERGVPRGDLEGVMQADWSRRGRSDVELLATGSCSSVGVTRGVEAYSTGVDLMHC